MSEAEGHVVIEDDVRGAFILGNTTSEVFERAAEWALENGNLVVIGLHLDEANETNAKYQLRIFYF
jgi:hypothetical protein